MVYLNMDIERNFVKQGQKIARVQGISYLDGRIILPSVGSVL